jgi:transcriptional regulator with XRE-family HTH domain
MATSAFKKFVLDRLEASGISARQLAEMAEISPATLSKLLSYKKDTQPDTDTIVKLARAMEVEPIELFELTVADAGSRRELDAEAAMLAFEYSRLPAKEREMISDLITTMRNRRTANGGA